MAREVVEGVHWIQEYTSSQIDEYDLDTPEEVFSYLKDNPDDWYNIGANTMSAYLLQDEKSLLFDTLSPAAEDQILRELDDILGSDGLDYLVPSHTDVQHAANSFAILEAYPDAELISPQWGEKHDLYHLQDARFVDVGTTLELGRFTVEFIEPTFPDSAIHTWLFEHTERILFTVDWFGFPVLPDETLRFVDEFDGGFTLDRLYQFHALVVFWYQYADLDKVDREIDHLIERFEPMMLAPAHGNVARKDAVEYMEMIKSVAANVRDEGRIDIAMNKKFDRGGE